MSTSRYLSAVATVLTLSCTPPDGGLETVSSTGSRPSTEIVQTDDWHDLKLIASLRGFIPAVMDAQGTPGLNVALARRGRVVWEAGFGYADQRTMKPMTPQTVFRSGSMGKAYTATAVMQLVEDGVFELDAPINRYLPFEVHNPLGERDITVRDLLTHHSGLYGNAAGSDFEPPAPLGEHLAAEYQEEFFPPYGRSEFRRWHAPVGDGFSLLELRCGHAGVSS